MARELCVAVASHRPYRMPDDPSYLPLLVGTAVSGVPSGCETWVHDDEGDSISSLNPSLSELTGLWWVWKNVEAEYKGLVHYRRLLGSPHWRRRHCPDRFERFATGDELLDVLRHTGIMVGKRRKYYIETVYSHYGHTFDAAQFDACREVLADLYPGYVRAWDHLMSSRGAHVYNILCMRSDVFDEYCSWLFSVLRELMRRYRPSGMNAFAARWPGRVSERLLDPWLDVNGKQYKELPVVSPEPIDWIAKGSGFLRAKFLGHKYDGSF